MSVSPTEEQVLELALRIRKGSPELGVAKLLISIKALEPEWMLSLARLKTILRSQSAGHADAVPASYSIPEAVKPKLYVDQTVSGPVPNLSLPPTVDVFVSTTRGKGLEAKTAIPATTTIWTEPALVLIPPVSLAQMIPSGQACSFCARPLSSASAALIASCSTCSGRWCSSRCRKADKLHKHIRHGRYTAEWVAIEQYAAEAQWSAVYLYSYAVAAAIFDDGTGVDIKAGIDGLAKISQEIRQKADPQIEQNIFALDNFDILWHDGYKVVNNFFKNFPSPPTYDDFLAGIGMVNINNLDGSIYLLQSHLNHSCEPSVDVKIVSRTTGVKVTAKRDLAKGEELTTTYVDRRLDLKTRRDQLLEGWGFWCTCPRCLREENPVASAPVAEEAATKVDAAADGTDEVADRIADLDVSTSSNSKKKKKNSKSKKKAAKEEPVRLRKKSVTFDETVVQIEI
ncbi:hypothetical protein BZA70DRAFT_270660 [Myxozyma melibiosi]|uniref:Histone-lysine N-methyltransferase SET5 n=1 Tax=Myxozyma melibiosi TaxID=54550 RepID=A0ABR1FBF8_9ASCO